MRVFDFPALRQAIVSLLLLYPSVFISVTCLLRQGQFKLLSNSFIYFFLFHASFCLYEFEVWTGACMVEMKMKWRQRKPFYFISYLLFYVWC